MFDGLIKKIMNRIRISCTNEKAITELLMGHKVKVDENILILDNGIRLEVLPNEGCGGCYNGWYGIDYLNDVDNAITNVEFECVKKYPDAERSEEYIYRIFVYAEDKKINLLSVSGDDGNGYYGTGYELEVTFVKEGEQNEM